MSMRLQAGPDVSVVSFLKPTSAYNVENETLMGQANQSYCRDSPIAGGSFAGYRETYAYMNMTMANLSNRPRLNFDLSCRPGRRNGASSGASKISLGAT